MDDFLEALSRAQAVMNKVEREESVLRGDRSGAAGADDSSGKSEAQTGQRIRERWF